MLNNETERILYKNYRFESKSENGNGLLKSTSCVQTTTREFGKMKMVKCPSYDTF